jgi:aminopeptidase
VLKAGGHPSTYVDLEGLAFIRYMNSNDDQLDHVSPITKLVFETSDVEIAIRASSNLFSLDGVPPERISRVSKAYAKISQSALERSASGDYRWVVTDFPSHAMAQVMEMSLPAYEDFYYRCTFTDQEDPIGAWRAFAARQDKIVARLSGTRQIQLKGPDIDLQFSVAGRHFISDAGQFNLPDGEIETSPVEDTVNGWIRYKFPAIFGGCAVTGVELPFKDGRVEEATAQEGQSFLLEMLNTDAGARYVGEFAIGTNPAVDRFTKRILFDEKMAGTIHLALGKGYPESGSQNRSAIHWDMICDMREGGQILADGELVYEAGKFRI